MYDFLIAGAGLYGAAAARILTDKGCKVLVIDRRPHIAGNAYTENIGGIDVHRYGPHIFHTDDERVWRFVNRFADFNCYVHRVQATCGGKTYSMPFNMFTYEQLWSVSDPDEARDIIRKQAASCGLVSDKEPATLEEYAVRMAGTDIYNTLIRGYSEKQWGRSCSELPASIISRIPLRFTYDDRYFTDRYQGIPVDGYTAMTEKMLEGIEVRLTEDYLSDRKLFDRISERIIYSGQIDEFFGYSLGELEYRSVRLEDEIIDSPHYQECAVMNYTGSDVPWTRIIEHKWFAGENDTPKTIISREYSMNWQRGEEPFYPVCDARSQSLYLEYRKLADRNNKVIFGGRLGTYRYLDMDDVIAEAIKDYC